MGTGSGANEKAREAPPTHAFSYVWEGDCFGKSPPHSQPLCFVCPAYFCGKHLKAQTKRSLEFGEESVGAVLDVIESLGFSGFKPFGEGERTATKVQYFENSLNGKPCLDV